MKPNFRPAGRDLSTPRQASRPAKTYPWWMIMCLSGVDYYSTLGYQPGIAVQAAGAVAPIATIILVMVTLAGAVPVYRFVASRSSNGLGSIALVEKLVRGWSGKLIILVLLGFALTDFMITITLSSADATAHLLHTSRSPWTIPITLALIFSLTAVFLRGFREAVHVAVLLVLSYLTLTAVVLSTGLWHLATDGAVAGATGVQGASTTVETPAAWAGDGHLGLLLLALIVFPKLALGLSGFETGVSVMPLINGNQEQRIRRGRRLVTVSAVIMSVFLIGSSLVATYLIPAAVIHGEANGRALAWLAHSYLGPVFGTTYDLVTVVILWFAGASAMSGMLALLPRYLPRYGMAPAWARRSRPMLLVLTACAVVVTLAFGASVDAQSGAYATGVLVVLSTGAWSATLLSTGARRVAYGMTAVVLTCTLGANILERPDGIRVALFFIIGVLVISAVSRTWRAYEIRDVGVHMDQRAENIIRTHTIGPELALVPVRCGVDLPAKERHTRMINNLTTEPIVFLEVVVHDPSVFADNILIEGHASEGIPILTVHASSVPNAVAVTACEIQQLTGVTPDIYFEWAPGNPLWDMARFLVVGRGQNATITREMLRRREAHDGRAVPRVHVG